MTATTEPIRATGERPPKRAAAPKIAPKRLAELLLLPVGVANTFAFLALPQEYRNDILSDQEQTELAGALAGVVALHPQAVKVLAGAAASTPYLALTLCVANIALVRLVRHGVLPSTVLGAVVGLQHGHEQAAEAAGNVTATGAVATGSTSSARGGYGERQVNAGGNVTPFTPVRGGVADKTR